MNFICLNGKLLPADKPALLVSNRSYRYGDGLFETMKVMNGRIILERMHFERLFSGMAMLMMDKPGLLTPGNLSEQILQLCKRNDCENLARVRLSAFRGNGGLYDEPQLAEYVIECWPLDATANELNSNGLVIDFFSEAQKACNKLSNIKSASCQLYSLAAIFAKATRLNDCLVLNTAGHIADTTIANVFLVKNDSIFTPALDQGCVAGVMRRHLVELLYNSGQEVQETEITPEDVLQADEIFLTNAIKGIRWVRQLRGKTYDNSRTTAIYHELMKTISF